jgi:hypothetical protein
MITTVAVEPEFGTVEWITFKVRRAEADLTDVALFLWREAKAHKVSFTKMVEHYRQQGADIPCSERTLYRRLESAPVYQQDQERKHLNPSAGAARQRKYEEKKRQICQDVKNDAESFIDVEAVEVRDRDFTIHPVIPELQPVDEVEAWEDDLLWYGEVERRKDVLPQAGYPHCRLEEDGSVTFPVTISAAEAKFIRLINENEYPDPSLTYEEFVKQCFHNLHDADANDLFTESTSGLKASDYFTFAEMEELDITYYWDGDDEEAELESQHEPQEQSNAPTEKHNEPSTPGDDSVEVSLDVKTTKSYPGMSGVELRKELQRRFGKDKVQDQYVIHRCRKTKPEGYLFDCVMKDFGIKLEIAGKTKLGNLYRIVDEAG